MSCPWVGPAACPRPRCRRSPCLRVSGRQTLEFVRNLSCPALACRALPLQLSTTKSSSETRGFSHQGPAGDAWRPGPRARGQPERASRGAPRGAQDLPMLCGARPHEIYCAPSEMGAVAGVGGVSHFSLTSTLECPSGGVVSLTSSKLGLCDPYYKTMSLAPSKLGGCEPYYLSNLSPIHTCQGATSKMLKPTLISAEGDARRSEHQHAHHHESYRWPVLKGSARHQGRPRQPTCATSTRDRARESACLSPRPPPRIYAARELRLSGLLHAGGL